MVLTQISSSYETILSETAAPVMHQLTSCPNVSAEAYHWDISISTIPRYNGSFAHPNHIPI